MLNTFSISYVFVLINFTFRALCVLIVIVEHPPGAGAPEEEPNREYIDTYCRLQRCRNLLAFFLYGFVPLDSSTLRLIRVYDSDVSALMVKLQLYAEAQQPIDQSELSLDFIQQGFLEQLEQKVAEHYKNPQSTD